MTQSSEEPLERSIVPPSTALQAADAAGPLAGGGEMGALMRELDWMAHPLGPVERWPESLRTMVGVVLANQFPMLIWWGPELRHLYNDAYRPILGVKHPASIGEPAGQVWSEIWHIVGPRALKVLAGGGATFDEDLLLPMDRHGYVEETYFTFSYSPIPDPSTDSGVGGVLVTVTETTARVVGERRVRALRDLGARASAATSVEEACAVSVRTLGEHARDIPFAALYLIDRAGTRARLAASIGLESATPASAEIIVLGDGEDSSTMTPWPLVGVARERRARVHEGLDPRVGAFAASPWPEPVRMAVVLPIPSSSPEQVAGLLVAGVSPRLALDEGYRGFLDIMAGQVGSAIANARAHEEERQRVEALAELDRAKTAFFANVSHEFRTPLTLLLGPIGRALQRRIVDDAQREDLELAERGALRLLKLVNSLLDFSRIEAGRIAAAYEPTDLATFTAELASTFRAAVEAAGMQLVVDAPPLAEPVYVDREMWEKIVLNLLSNAFKHTFEGTITVRLRAADGHVRLVVEDTGVGIAAGELPRVFERFHRVANARSRTHEGTGIGLALVQELATLHGGEVGVTSEEGTGTAFVVRIPLGSSHLPAERVGAVDSTASAEPSRDARAHVVEALRWATGEPIAEPSPRERLTNGALADVRVLLADDNADVRQYVSRLLADEGWSVRAVADGNAALDVARTWVPDLVLSDVMMPGLDGFALLRALRADPATSALPVILLSARAGEESRVEGANVGADDYLVKPFSAQELVARVGAQVRLARHRRDAESTLRRRTAQFQTLLNDAPLGVYVVDGDFRIREVNPIAQPAFGDAPDLTGCDFADVMHRMWPAAHADEVVAQFRHTLATGEPYVAAEWIDERLENGETEYYEWQISRIELPEGGYGVVCYFRDIGAHVHARRQLEQARREAEDARAVAEHANRAKSDFLAAMSHEFRTPLNAIAGYVELLGMGLHGPVTPTQVSVLDRIQKSEQHLLSLINDVLNFAKLEAGHVEYHVREVRLGEVIDAVLPMIEAQLAAKGLRHRVVIDQRITVRADRDKLQQILLNLLSNAVKFTPAGGWVSVDDAWREGAPPEEVFVRVSDTGIGIDRDKQVKIFDPFVQVHRNLTRPTEGTGLGLAISRDLARGMGGELRVRSEEGEGSTFTLTLPRGAAVSQ